MIPRIINGGWQLAAGHAPGAAATAGNAHRLTTLDVLQGMVASSSDTVAFDCADIYTGVEELFGEMLARLDPKTRTRVRVHTKFVPDLGSLETLEKPEVEAVIDRSLKRLGVEALDLVQFHWWDWETAKRKERMLKTAGWLQELKRAGKIRDLGATNFDAVHLQLLLDEGIEILSHQVQYSLLDRRPAAAMAALCREHEIALLCYGSLAGGFLTERWLGQPEPALEALANRSLVKYLLIIEEFGGFLLFQELLGALAEIAAKHSTDAEARYGVHHIAICWLLSQPSVTSAIVGMSHQARRTDTERALKLTLDAEDHARLDALLGRAQGPRGRIYELERDRTGRHGSIMKYNLNTD